MIRRSIAGAILGISLLAGSFAWWGFLAQRTVLDPDRSREVAEELLENDEVRAQLVENISAALLASIPDDVPVSDDAVNSAAEQVLNDPAIEELFLRAFTDTHAAFLGDGNAPENIDLTPVAESARSAVVAGAPQLDGLLPAAPVFNVPLPTERIPDASPLRSFLRRVVPVVAVAAIIGAAVALFATTDRPGVLRRAGTWALTTTAVYLVLGLGVPWLLRRFAPEGAEVLAALLAALLRATLVPSIVLGVVGAGLLVLSGVWAANGSMRRRSRSPRDDEPRRAARRTSADPTPPSAGLPLPQAGMPPRQPQPQRRQPQPAGGQAGPQWFTKSDTPTRPQPAVPRRPVQAPQQTGRPAVAQPQPSSPYPDAAVGGGSPYPDGAGGGSPYPDGAGGAGKHSVFADVPEPSDAVGTHQAADRYAPRWREGHGWVLHPQDPRPLPQNARWVDGVGHVVPGPPPAAQ